MTTIYLLRHGESEANVRRVFSNGKLDLPLTELGRQQAARAGRWLMDKGITHVYTAPLLRARQTARILAEQLILGDPIVLQDLDEVRVGDLDTRDDTEAWACYDVIFGAWLNGDEDSRFPGGESFAEARHRYAAALRQIADAHPNGTVVAATHGGIQLTVLPRLCPTITFGPAGPQMPHVAINRLEVTPDGIACSLWASTAHLETD
ncbi:MAG TPA: histidine phosphatase family protein [Chloroflexota bacterium]|nr:histidine phosphatase family protein [Chloroflexota bacterium]